MSSSKKFLCNDYTPNNSKEYNLDYKCFHCIEDEIERKEEAKREKQRILDEIFQKHGIKNVLNVVVENQSPDERLMFLPKL